MNENVSKLFDMVKATAVAAGDIAGEAVDAAGRKVNDLWSSARLQIEVVDLQSDINTVYRELGELVYAAHTNPSEQPEGVDEKLGVLDEKNLRLKEIRERLDSLKQMSRCPNENCSAAVDKNDSFCRFCGTDLHPLQEDAE